MARLATAFSQNLKRPGLKRHGAAALLVAGLLSACSTVSAPPRVAQAPQAAPAPVAPMPDMQGPVKVAVLVPLSGQSAAIGQSMLDAAQMALFDMAGDRLELLPRDTKGTPNGAADAARQALADGAKLIIGPLFAADVAAVRPIAQNAGVEVLAFTNDSAQAGNGTYVMGFVPADQVNRVAGFARSQGVTRFTVLAPRSPYGDAVVNAMQAAGPRLGTAVTQVERYDAAVTDLSQPARQVAQEAPLPQAVMLAEGGPRAQGIASALAANGVPSQQVKLLGTGLWDDSSQGQALGREPALVGAWYAAPAPQNRARFESQFEQVYGRKPPRIATLAYDATSIAAVLTRSGGPVPFDRMAMTNPNGFEGLDGLFRLRGDGQVERGLAVMEVTPTGARVVDPAPPTFEMLGQ